MTRFCSIQYSINKAWVQWKKSSFVRRKETQISKHEIFRNWEILIHSSSPSHGELFGCTEGKPRVGLHNKCWFKTMLQFMKFAKKTTKQPEDLQVLREAQGLQEDFSWRVFFIPEPSMHVRAMLTLQMSLPYSPKSAFSLNVIAL